MLETLKTFISTVKDNKIKLLLVLFLSFFTAIINEYCYEQKYKVTYEVAPYFEMASDLGNQFGIICEAINNNDTNYLKSKLKTSLPINFIEKATYKKISKTVDYSYKHFNVKITFELSNNQEAYKLIKWDSAMTKFGINYVNDSLRKYRGISVYEEKMKTFVSAHELNNINKNEHDDQKNLFSNQNIILNDSIVTKLVYAFTKGEYENAKKINQLNFFSQSHQKIPRKLSWIELFLSITFLPTFFFLVILRSIKYQ